MKESDNGYRISFFKPTTDRARFNRSIVVWLASIWFIAIFGFQIVLRVIEKPTPEPPFTAFENVWESVKNGTAEKSELQAFANSTLAVLGKIAITEDERSLLSRSMSWSAIRLTPDSLRPAMTADIAEFETLKASGISFNDQKYIAKKNALAKKFIPVVGLSKYDPLTRILPLELTAQGIASLPEEGGKQSARHHAKIPGAQPVCTHRHKIPGISVPLFLHVSLSFDPFYRSLLALLCEVRPPEQTTGNK